MKDRSADLLQKTRMFDKQNLRIAKDALRDPEKCPHLQEWARLVVRRLEGIPVKDQQELQFEAA